MAQHRGSPQRSALGTGPWQTATCVLLFFWVAIFGLYTSCSSAALAATARSVGTQAGQRRGLREATASATSREGIQKISILGERHSGTNLIEKLLKQNLDGSQVVVDGGFTSHKHWMQPDPQDESQTSGTLLVLAVRNPYDWARALYQMCYCCESMQGLLMFPDFARTQYMPSEEGNASGYPCTSDVDIEHGNTSYSSVMYMREAKIENALRLADRWGLPLEVVRLEDMWYPELQVTWVEQLAAKYDLPLNPKLAAHREEAAAAQQQQQNTAGGPLSSPRSLRRGLYTLLLSSSSSSRTGLASAGSGRGKRGVLGAKGEKENAPPEPALQVIPIVGEVRDWAIVPFEIGDRVRSSIYLSMQHMQQDVDLKPTIETINSLINVSLEASLGYHSLDVNSLPWIIAEDGAGRQQPGLWQDGAVFLGGRIKTIVGTERQPEAEDAERAEGGGAGQEPGGQELPGVAALGSTWQEPQAASRER